MINQNTKRLLAVSATTYLAIIVGSGISGVLLDILLPYGLMAPGDPLAGVFVSTSVIAAILGLLPALLLTALYRVDLRRRE